MRKKGVNGLFIQLFFTFFAAVVLTACGGGSDGGTPAEGPTPTVTDLGSAVNRELTTAPIISVRLQRQNGDNIQGATVSYSREVTFADLTFPLEFMSAVSGDDGRASGILKEGNYRAAIEGDLPQVVGEAQYDMTVTGNKMPTKQTSEQQWDITSAETESVPLKSITITLYRSNSDGQLDWTGIQDPDPDDLPQVLALSVTEEGLGGETFVQLSTELFEGTYVVVVNGEPVGDESLGAVSEVLPIPGGGTTDSYDLTLPDSGCVLSLTLLDTGSDPLADYDIETFDRTTQLPLGEATTDSDGLASILTGTHDDVVVLIRDGDDDFAGVYYFSDMTDGLNHETLTLYQVSGFADPSEGTLVEDDAAVITIKTNSGLGEFFDVDLPNVPMLEGFGTFTAKLFGHKEGLSYIISAAGVKDFPTVTAKQVTVQGDLEDVTIPVSPGAVIAGRIQDESRDNLQGIEVVVREASEVTVVASDTTDDDGMYSVEVPYGTYDLWARGAVTANITVSESSPTFIQNLTRYQITGRVTDESGRGLDATVSYGGGGDTADTLGIYTVQVMEGLNWFFFRPPADEPTLGAEYVTNVLVNDDTVATLEAAVAAY